MEGAARILIPILLTRKPKATLLDRAATLARVLLRVKASGRPPKRRKCFVQLRAAGERIYVGIKNNL